MNVGSTQDPRDDLGGVDVARKALILARGLGWRLELDDVDVSPLYPPTLADLSVDDFMDALPSLDADFEARAADAKAQGMTLRYAANVEDGKLKVGLTSVARDSPLGSLSGADQRPTRATPKTVFLVHRHGQPRRILHQVVRPLAPRRSRRGRGRDRRGHPR